MRRGSPFLTTVKEGMAGTPAEREGLMAGVSERDTKRTQPRELTAWQGERERTPKCERGR